MLKSNAVVRAALTAFILPLCGCGAWQAASGTSVAAYDAVFDRRVKTVDIDLTARVKSNRDSAGRSSPVVVRVYQLKDRKRFDGASYADLTDKDRTVLASDVLMSSAVVIHPGASASISQPMQKDTAFVAIAAFSRQPDKSGSWNQVIAARKLPRDAPLRLILVDGNSVVTDAEVQASRK